MASAKYALPPLLYGYDALEPYISKEIMTLHHDKHHQAYITNLNAALVSRANAASKNDLATQLHLQNNINFHGGGHINHSLFWENLSPASQPSSKSSAAPRLVVAINARWGSLPSFQEKFKAFLFAIKGSGWGWLVQDSETGNLEILGTKDQDVVPAGKKPIFGVDMWEHAYYLQYLNDKGAYADGIWNVINWEKSERRFVGSTESIFGELVGLKASM